MIKDIWFRAEEIVLKSKCGRNSCSRIKKKKKTIIMFIACVGVFAVLLISTLSQW